MSRALRICWIALLGSVALCHASVQIEWREAKPEDVPTAALAARPEAPPASMPETFRRPVSCRQNTDKIKRALFVFETDAADAGGTVGYEAELDARGELVGTWKPLPPPSVDGTPAQTYRLTGETVLPMGHQHLLLPARDAAGAPKLLAYHTVTTKWFELGDVPGGAWSAPPVLLPDSDSSFLLCQRDGAPSGPCWRARLVRTERFSPINYVVLAVYIACLLIAAAVMMVRSRRQQQSADSYFKGDGKLPWWAVGVSIYAAMFSAISLIAGPAVSYLLNWSYFTVVLSKLLIVPIIAGYYLPFFRRLNLTSAYEYLEARFNLACRLFASAAFSGFSCSAPRS